MGITVLLFLVYVLCSAPTAGPQTQPFDVLIRNGMVYDGTGSPGRRVDIGVRGDRIAGIGQLDGAAATTIVDASSLAVAPGFINMLSWATESLLVDGRSQGDIRQGVTLEIFGEGSSMGPLTDAMKKRMVEEMGDIKFDITWTSLSEYLKDLERRGISTNVASFIGATTIREYVIGLEDKKPTPQQLDEMRALVRQEMEAGALGIGSSLIYAPAFYASTEELIELCKVAAQYQGKYISHMRSEGNRLIEAVQELIRISREAKIPAEIYHLKAAGQANWPKMDKVIAMVEQARKEGLKITADMYNYPAGATGLDAAMPPWVLDGGYDEAYKRLKDPATRKKIAHAISTPTSDWENLYLAAGSADRVLLVEFKSEALKPLDGQDARRGSQIAWRGSGPDNHEPRARRPVARRNGVFHDGRGQHPEADQAALGLLRIRCIVDGARAAIYEVERPPARVWKLFAPAWTIRSRRKDHSARRGRQATERAAGHEPRDRSPWVRSRRHVCRCRRLRSGSDLRPRDL